jgi:hypothetical protein
MIKRDPNRGVANPQKHNGQMPAPRYMEEQPKKEHRAFWEYHPLVMYGRFQQGFWGDVFNPKKPKKEEEYVRSKPSTKKLPTAEYRPSSVGMNKHQMPGSGRSDRGAMAEAGGDMPPEEMQQAQPERSETHPLPTWADENQMRHSLI